MYVSYDCIYNIVCLYDSNVYLSVCPLAYLKDNAFNFLLTRALAIGLSQCIVEQQRKE